MRTIQVHRKVTQPFLPTIVNRYEEARVEVRGYAESVKIFGERVERASDEDLGTEYLDYIIAIKIVSSMDEAIDYINKYSSHHTDAIIAENVEDAHTFLGKVDSARVL